MFSRKCDFCIILPYNTKNARKRAHKDEAEPKSPGLIVIVCCWAAVYVRQGRELS